MIELDKIRKLITLFERNKAETYVKGQETFTTLDQFDFEAYDKHVTTKALRDYVNGLQKEEVIDLIAIMFLGRSDFSEFETCRMQAESIYVSDESPSYLLSKKDLVQYLNDGTKKLGLTE